MKDKGHGGWYWIIGAALILALGIGAYFLWNRPRINSEALKEIPLLQQSDYPEAVTTFGGKDKSVATSGCGAVCMAMALTYLKGKKVSPQDLFQWACDNGYYFGDGLGHEALTAMAQLHGMEGLWIGNDELDRVKQALAKGYPVVAHMGPGVFTRGGHYILLRGLEGENVLVSDPQSPELSAQAHPLQDVARELRRENSFMIVMPKGGSI